MTEKIPYSSIRPQIRPFHILLFSGTGAISRIIQVGSGSRWSHVGLALRIPEFPFALLPEAARKRVMSGPQALGDRVLILESTTLSDIDDLLTGRPIKGVSIVPLSERLAAYDGAVAWRPVAGARPSAMFEKSRRFVAAYHGTPYEDDQLQLARAALDHLTLKDNQPDTHSLFCSEAACLFMRAVGLFAPQATLEPGPIGWPANEFTPGDFAGKSILPWALGYGAGRVVEMVP